MGYTINDADLNGRDGLYSMIKAIANASGQDIKDGVVIEFKMNGVNVDLLRFYDVFTDRLNGLIEARGRNLARRQSAFILTEINRIRDLAEEELYKKEDENEEHQS